MQNNGCTRPARGMRGGRQAPATCKPQAAAAVVLHSSTQSRTWMGCEVRAVHGIVMERRRAKARRTWASAAAPPSSGACTAEGGHRKAQSVHSQLLPHGVTQSAPATCAFAAMLLCTHQIELQVVQGEHIASAEGHLGAAGGEGAVGGRARRAGSAGGQPIWRAIECKTMQGSHNTRRHHLGKTTQPDAQPPQAPVPPDRCRRPADLQVAAGALRRSLHVLPEELADQGGQQQVHCCLARQSPLL